MYYYSAHLSMQALIQIQKVFSGVEGPKIEIYFFSLYLYPPQTFFVVGILFIPPTNVVCGGYTVFTLSVHPLVRPLVRLSVRPSVTFCF